MASYERALAIKPDHAEALNGRGLALQGQKRFEDALASYDKSLTIKPDFAWALYNRGNTLRDLSASRTRWRATSGRSRSSRTTPRL